MTYDASTKTITLPPIEVKQKAYTVIAALNAAHTIAKSKFESLTPVYSGIDYYREMQNIPHNYSLFTTPVNLYAAFGSTALNAVTGADYFLWRNYTGSLFPEKYTIPTLNISLFLMTNANGPLQLKTSDIKATSAAAKAAPLTIPVERAVAKVGVFKGKNITSNSSPYSLPNGAKITEPTWSADVINLRTFLVRQKAFIAPDKGSVMETDETIRDDRYATDPNFSNLSKEKPGSTSSVDLGTHFFYIPKKATGDSYLVRNWIPDDLKSPDFGMLDVIYKLDYQYVTENTMEADEQYEDVTTRIVLRCQYIPSGFNQGDSFYYYRGHAFSHAQILQFIANPSLIPVATYPELVDLAQVLADLEVRKTFWPDRDTVSPLKSIDPNNPPSAPKESVTLKGLTYYEEGVTYYSIPIRHFEDKESSVPMGYGRYGVVRNNVYRVVIDDILGPGYIDIPDRIGPDDKTDGKIKVSSYVTPWRVKNLHFDL